MDASYALHKDCRRHNVAMMSLGKGNMQSFSRKQNIYGKSSTKDDLIVTYYSLIPALWTKYFIGTHRYTVVHNIIHQYKTIAILLEVNGKFSSSKQRKHTKTRYFFIKDIIEKGDVEVTFCTNEYMWPGLLAEAKQGKALHEYGLVLMNFLFD